MDPGLAACAAIPGREPERLRKKRQVDVKARPCARIAPPYDPPGQQGGVFMIGIIANIKVKDGQQEAFEAVYRGEFAADLPPMRGDRRRIPRRGRALPHASQRAAADPRR